MNRHLFSITFLFGLIAIVWVGAGFVSTNLLALTVTALVGVVYGVGALELRQFRQASADLTTALSALAHPPTDLAEWLDRVPAPLQNAVRLRIEGERVALPSPALTPYLVGLLVMLGMLGTFLGMVVTLNGAAFSLEGTADLQTIRTALAAPIKGLGLAFGTSVAGVAASAMLGLMSALSRRDRMLAVHMLDTQIATRLRGFSHTHQRQQAYQALQVQAQALPEVVDKLHLMMAQMAHTSQQLNERLLHNQDRFHSEVKGLYSDLAASVDQSLKDSLTQSAKLAADGIQPVVQAAMDGMAQEARLMHQRVIEAAQVQLEGLSVQLGATANAVTHTWSAALADMAAQTQAQQQHICTTLASTAQDITAQAHTSAQQTLSEVTRLMSTSEQLVNTRIASEATWVSQHSASIGQLAALLRAEFGALRDDEAQRGQQAVARLGELQTALAQHLTTLGVALEDPIKRLIDTASEAPRAAADVIGQLRREMSGAIVRDNALLEERARIMQTLNALLDTIRHASVEQRGVIDALVASAAVSLNQASGQFSEQLDAQTGKLASIAAQVTSGAVEVSSLGETFGFAVNSFNQANEKLIGNLQRIEGALDKSMARSDDQLAYYVAQAREVIELSVMSQKEIFEALRQLPGQAAPSAQGVG